MRWREPSTILASKMSVATFRAEVTAGLQGLAWDQWSQLGLSAASPAHREERAADPEALLLFTLQIGRSDPRLFDEMLDWLTTNESLVSTHRLRNLCANPTDEALVESALRWTRGVGPRRRSGPVAAARIKAIELQPVFPGVPGPHDNLDRAFAEHGLARSGLDRSGKSVPPRLSDPISFALRLRRLLGNGARAEVIRALLTIRAPRLSGKVITASAGFSQRNVREALMQLREAGVVDVADVSDDRYYSLHPDRWAALLGFATTPDLPLHYDWIPALRALTRISRWLDVHALDELSPYIRASKARTLMTDLDADLRYAGVSASINTAMGADYWDEFVAVTRAAIDDARATSRS